MTRTDPPAGTPLSRGALVGYWVASGAKAKPNSAWPLLLLLAGALAAVVAAATIAQRMRLVKIAPNLLNVAASLDPNGVTNFPADVPMAGPTTRLQATLEIGETHFERDVPIVKTEVQND